MPLCVALEIEDWSWSSLRSNFSLLRLMCKASRQCFQMAGLGKIAWLYRSPLVWFLLLLAPLLTYFSLEAMYGYHFRKVGSQTKAFIDQFIEHGNREGFQTDNLELLAGKNWRWTTGSRRKKTD